MHTVSERSAEVCCLIYISTQHEGEQRNETPSLKAGKKDGRV